MDRTEQLKGFLQGQFEGVIDDNFVEIEEQTIQLLQDRFDYTARQADKILQRYLHPFVKFSLKNI